MRIRGQRMGLKAGLALAGAVALAVPAISKGQIAVYNFGPNGTSFTYAATTLDSNVTASGINSTNDFGVNDTFTPNNGVGGESSFYTNNPGGNYLSVSQTGSTTDNGFWIEMIITANAGYVIDPTTFELYGGAGGSSAVRSAYIYDNIDGFPTNIATNSSGAPTFTNGDQLASGTFTAVRGAAGPPNMNEIQVTSFPIDDVDLTSFTVRAYFDTQGNVNKNIDLGSLELDGSVVAAPPQGQSFWVTNGSGDYNNLSNWANGIPNGIGNEAEFLGAITSNQVVYTTTPITLGSIVFNNSNASYALTGAVGTSLTLQAATGSALVDVQAGTHEINLPLTLASNTTFQTDVSSANLIIANPMTINSGISLTTTGSGTVTYDSTITLLSGATMSIASSTYAHSLTINATAAVSLAPTTSSKTVLQVDSLSLAGSPGAWTGKLDLANNDMIVHSGSNGESVGATVASEVASGRGSNGLWTGNGITSSAAAASPTNMALAVVINDTNQSGTLSGNPLISSGSPFNNGLTTFDGQNVADGDVLVKYTYYGDALLTGSVTAADYIQIDNGFQNHLTGWSNGDFNYDGVINGDDYTLIDNAFNSQGAALHTVSSAGPAEMIAGASSSAVPEPATLSMIGTGAAGLMMRRRRRGRLQFR